MPGRLDVQLDVETPEQVAFSYVIAGIGSRAAAAMVDGLLCVAALLVLTLLAGLASAHWGVSSPSASWIIAAYMLALFVTLWGYYVLFEGLNDGQTPGKRLFRLRVVRDGGRSVSFGASAARNLVRVIDILPAPLYLVGVVTALLNPARKRLGDMAAGTMVIREGDVLPSAQAARAPTGETGGALPVAMLTDVEYDLLDRYMQRRNALMPERRRALAGQVAARLARHLPAMAPEAVPGALLRLHEAERDARARGVAVRSDRGARREQHALVALGRARWNDFAMRLAAARRGRFARMSPAEVSDFVARYREVSTDLARLRTASRGRDSESLFYLNRLVAGAHALLYRERGHALPATARYLFSTVPREVRRSWRPIALAAALLFGPALVAYVVVVRDPSTASAFVGDEMQSRAVQGAARERRGEGYVTITAPARPIAASLIISNNVQITYLAFALGMTAGVGTVLVLVLNGISLGGGFGVFAVHRVLHLLVAFVVPHGVLELTAICIAAGAGFLLAAALLLPGVRTRRDALVENGRRAVTLLAASTLLLAVAGTIEGLISPRVWPLSAKLAVSLATVVALAVYLHGGSSHGSREATAPTVP